MPRNVHLLSRGYKLGAVACLKCRSFSDVTYAVIATLPVGVPLAGYNHAERRVPDWPLVEETKYTTVSCVVYL